MLSLGALRLGGPEQGGAEHGGQVMEGHLVDGLFFSHPAGSKHKMLTLGHQEGLKHTAAVETSCVHILTDLATCLTNRWPYCDQKALCVFVPFKVLQQSEEGHEVGVGQRAQEVHHAVLLGCWV